MARHMKYPEKTKCRDNTEPAIIQSPSILVLYSTVQTTVQITVWHEGST